MSKEYITMDNRRAYTYICELDKVNRNNTILNKDALNFSNEYHDTGLLTDATSSLISDIEELKQYLNSPVTAITKEQKKRKITVRVRI
jgi:hypothetical protein